MAKKVVLLDDITGEVITEGLGQSVEFSFNGKHYTIDLGVTNLDKLKAALKPWIESATEIEAERPRPTVRRRTAGSASSGMSREQREAIREWANSNGYTVGDRGRIKQEIVDAFEAAHNSSGS